MQTKMKQNSIVASSLVSPTEIKFAVRGYTPFIFDLEKVHPDMRAHAEIHGWVQKVVDAAAIPASDADGNPIPESLRCERKDTLMRAVVAHFESFSSEWKMNSSGDAVMTGLTVRAIARAYGITVELAGKRVAEIAKRDSKTTNAVLTDLRQSNAKVKAAYRALEDEIRPTNDEADDFLTEIEALPESPVVETPVVAEPVVEKKKFQRAPKAA